MAANDDTFRSLNDTSRTPVACVRPLIVAEVALEVIGWQVIQLFRYIRFGGFLLYHWSAGKPVLL